MTPHPPSKAAIPSPLPHHRGVLSLPDTLKTSITTALFASTGAIPNIQSAMRESLTRPSSGNTNANANANGMGNTKQLSMRNEFAATGEHGHMGALGTWLAGEFEREGAEDVGDEEMLRRLMDAVRAGRSDALNGGETDGDVNRSTKLHVPEQAVEEIVKAVRKELERCCVVVDGEEWVG